MILNTNTWICEGARSKESGTFVPEKGKVPLTWFTVTHSKKALAFMWKTGLSKHTGTLNQLWK